MQQISAVIQIEDPDHVLPATRARLAGEITAAIRRAYGSRAEDLTIRVVSVSAEQSEAARQRDLESVAGI